MALEIMHIDMDAFFAAVEQLDNPELKGKPVIVGGIGLDNRGVVSAASYEARKYGVHSAMPMIQARRLCPDGIYLSGRHHRYSEMSRKIFDIFYEFTPLVEGISIDEAFLDLTGCHRLFGDSIEIGKKIKDQIQERLGLTASVGLAPNKFLAKLASGMDKPDGFFIIPEDRISEILEPLPVGKIWGVGKKTEEALKKKGLDTIAKIKKLSINELEAMFGKMGFQLYHLARGIDNRSVEVDNQIKSISHEETFQEDLTDKNQILSSLLRMSSKVSRRLRKKGLEGNTIYIKVRYGDFTTYTRRITVSIATNDTDKIYRTGLRLLEREELLNKPVRLLGIGVSNLYEENRKQLSLFNDNIKADKLTKTIDGLKDKFGDNSVFRARNLD
ncbi:MAG: DNA polymerase IV [Halanaerobiales bacterium]